MDFIQAFRVAALKCGFVDIDECGDGTVMWLKRVAIDAAAERQQRICIDAVTDSATVYWTNVQGKLYSKTFRDVTTLRQWMNNSIPVERLNNAVLQSSSPANLPSVPGLSIAAGAWKRGP